MKVKVNWLQIIVEVVKVIIAGIAGGTGAALM